MKWSISPFVILLLLPFASCKKETVLLNENKIPLNECRSFTRDGKVLNCCLEAVIQDSRCPANVTCIWQGIAVARFGVNADNAHHTITLATTRFQAFRRDTTIAGFKIELISLSPQREWDKPFNDKNYVAEVSVTRP